MRSRALARGRAASRLGLPDYCRFWARCVHTWMARMSQLVVPQGCPEPDAQRTQQQELAEMRPARGCNTTASAQAGRAGRALRTGQRSERAANCGDGLQQPIQPARRRRAGGVQEVRTGRCVHLPAHQPSAISHQPSAISHGVARRCHACHRADSMRHHPPPPRALHPAPSGRPTRRGAQWTIGRRSTPASCTCNDGSAGASNTARAARAALHPPRPPTHHFGGWRWRRRRRRCACQAFLAHLPRAPHPPSVPTPGPV